jgi:hypothetical protein
VGPSGHDRGAVSGLATRSCPFGRPARGVASFAWPVARPRCGRTGSAAATFRKRRATHHSDSVRPQPFVEFVDSLLAVEDIVVLLTVQAIVIGSTEELVGTDVEVSVPPSRGSELA